MKNIAIIFVALLVFSACNNDDSTSLIIRLTDSPGDYEQVNIDLVGIEVHASSGTQTDGWQSLNVNTGVYDLLELTNGVETVLVDQEYPAGLISQVRLVLGNDNTVVIDGTTSELTIPSGSESGLKLNVHAELIEGLTYSLLLDFDAAKSVVKTGTSASYRLKPVIRVITEAQDGAIKGTILPDSLNVAVYAISGEDTLSTSYAVEGNSNYFLGGLASGSYTVSFDPGELSGLETINFENIEVVVGEVTDLGEESF